MVAATEIDELVLAARAGGGWAFGRLWEHLSPAVSGYLRGRGVVEAEDVCSEVFLAAFRQMDQFVGDSGAFRSWLFTIAHHKAVDDVRRRTRRAPEAPYEPAVDHRTCASAEDHALAQLEGHRVRRLLDTLAPVQRDVLLLRIVGDLTVEQVAAVLDKSPGAVKQLQRRGLEALRRAGRQESSSAPAVPLEAPPAIADAR